MDLKTFFEENPKVAVAFSGGTDSSYLLYAAKKYGADVTAYYVKGAFQPQFETNDALRLAREIGVPMKMLKVDVLSVPEVRRNPENRCYYCKNLVFRTILNAATEDGYTVLLDGTNASDDADDRPGMKALQELRVLSPLRMAGITKAEVRQRSREAGLFTWNKPAYACLATRIPPGEEITEEKLRKTERAEDGLFQLGFTDFRVRIQGEDARLEFPEGQMEALLSKREEVLRLLKKDYRRVLLNLEGRS